MKTFISFCIVSFIFLQGSVYSKDSPKKPIGPISLQEAQEFITNHAIHDAVIIAPPGAWHSSPALADIDKDGKLEIIAGAGQGYIGAWHCDGRPVAGWPQRSAANSYSIAVGDMNHDGNLEIVGAGQVWNSKGELLPGWDSSDRDCRTGVSTPSLVDLLGDGKLEVLYTDSQSGICIRKSDGSYLPGWPEQLPNNYMGCYYDGCIPLAYDVNGDGKKEIIVTREPGEIYAYNLDGKLLPDYPKHLDSPNQQHFVLADIHHNGTLELVKGNKSIDLSSGKITELGSFDGGMAPCLVQDNSGRITVAGPTLPRNVSIQSPDNISRENGWWNDSAVAADIDGDGKPEILFGNRKGGFHVYRQDGSQSAGWPKRLYNGADSALAVGDLFGDGYYEIVANTNSNRIYVFGSPGKADDKHSWPEFMANNLRNGISDPASIQKAQQKTDSSSQLVEIIQRYLSKGDWDSAIQIYQSALSVLNNHRGKFNINEIKELNQRGLLSIARIYNTRAKRFKEAAELYKKSIAEIPESWCSEQALIELTDMVHFCPDIVPARKALENSYELCKKNLTKVDASYANIYQYVLGEAGLTLEKDEALGFIKPLVKNSSRDRVPDALQTDATSEYLSTMSQNIVRYEGLPFLLNLQGQISYNVETKTKDLGLNGTAQGYTEYQLSINPDSPNNDGIPLTLQLSSKKNLLSGGRNNWELEKDGKYHSKVSKMYDSGSERETLFTQPLQSDLVSVQREVKRVDATHMHVKFIVHSKLSNIWYGFETRDTNAKILPLSVSPQSDTIFLNELMVRYQQRNNPNQNTYSDFTIEGTVQLPEGMKCFYPYFMVCCQSGGEEIQVEPKTPTKTISGFFEGVDYQLTSSSRFKLNFARKNIFWAYTLEKVDTDL